jgi:hypothetical protein
MNTRSPLDWRVLALVTAAALAIGLVGAIASMSGGTVMAPVWMALCAIFMLLVIALLVVAISILMRIGSSGSR